VFVLDFAERALNQFTERCPEFPKNRIICDDFFNHESTYDLIIEQTFFSALNPDLREQFATKISDLLNPKGCYVGLFFNHEFEQDTPPFGAKNDDYIKLFGNQFEILTFETAQHSIKPRAGREIFFIFRKKT